jgi:hypothetical protein
MFGNASKQLKCTLHGIRRDFGFGMLFGLLERKAILDAKRDSTRSNILELLRWNESILNFEQSVANMFSFITPGTHG